MCGGHLQHDSQVLLDERLERTVLAGHTLEAVHLLTISHEDDGRQPLHPQSRRELGREVRVELGDARARRAWRRSPR